MMGQMGADGGAPMGSAQMGQMQQRMNMMQQMMEQMFRQQEMMMNSMGGD